MGFELIGLSALVAAIVVGARKLRRLLRERSRPGATAATAIAIRDFAEIDIELRRQNCECGGRFASSGEGPVRDSGRPLRVANLECRNCGRERRVYFDLGEMRH